MDHRTIGTVDVSAVGLGAMPLSIEGRPDESQAVATLHAALDAGITFIDTADSYHWHAGESGHNELLIARALRSHGGDTSGVLVATKGGRAGPATEPGRSTARPTTSGAPPRHPHGAWASSRSACTSSTSRTRPCRGPTRSGR